jgi:arsenite methyltransferase
MALDGGPGVAAGSCGASLTGGGCVGARVYDRETLASLPVEAARLALGSGDPVGVAGLEPGQTVLDLGAGGGADCFLAARIVGPTGRVIGVDMTPEMVQRARATGSEAGFANVEFRLGEVEHLPVADESVDVVLSNCVINLSPDKRQVFREAYRVLKPGGALSVSDMMLDGPLPEALASGDGEYAQLVGGFVEEKDYVAAIEAAGFADVEVSRVYPDVVLPEEAQARLKGSEEGGAARARAVVMVAETGETVKTVDLDPADLESSTRSFSGKVRARKPA